MLDPTMSWIIQLNVQLEEIKFHVNAILGALFRHNLQITFYHSQKFVASNL